MRTLPTNATPTEAWHGMGTRTLLLPLLLSLTASSGAVSAQSSAAPATGPWSLTVRAVLSGSSDHSEPDGYSIYSGLALEAAVLRRLGRATGLALSLRTESREVEGPAAVGGHLGSLEMLPLGLTALWFPRGDPRAGLSPYVGAGIDLTVTWERSGALDSTHEPTRAAPMLQLGLDWSWTDRTALNLDARWHPLTVKVEDFAPETPSVRLDPLALGMGLRLRF